MGGEHLLTQVFLLSMEHVGSGRNTRCQQIVTEGGNMEGRVQVCVYEGIESSLCVYSVIFRQ